MKLVQKLPLGLALAACMMMSSCSQEDVAEPQVGKSGNPYNLKVAAVPSIPTTGGWAGDNVFAPGWEKFVTKIPDDKQLFATGTSTKTHLWGNPYMPWVKPLPQITAYNGNNVGNFVTFMMQKSNGTSTFSKVTTSIKNLVPGKKYMITFFASSAIRLKNGQPTQYCPGVCVEIPGTVQPNGSALTVVDLKGKEAEWVQKTITFQAQSTETKVVIFTYVSQEYYYNTPQFLHYGNVFVPQNAVIEEVP